MIDFAAARALMVETQLRGGGISDERVLRTMGEVLREAFMPDALAARAYDDDAVEVGDGQPISQPHMVAQMLEAASIRPGDRVLDIGTGSGYAAALLATLAAAVFTVERRESLFVWADARLAPYRNVERRWGDGLAGWPEAAPFDVILVAAAARDIPEALQRQLAPGGRLVLPVGDPGQRQCLVRITRDAAGAIRREDLQAAYFVPLLPDIVAKGG